MEWMSRKYSPIISFEADKDLYFNPEPEFIVLKIEYKMSWLSRGDISGESCHSQWIVTKKKLKIIILILTKTKIICKIINSDYQTILIIVVFWQEKKNMWPQYYLQILQQFQ